MPLLCFGGANVRQWVVLPTIDAREQEVLMDPTAGPTDDFTTVGFSSNRSPRDSSFEHDATTSVPAPADPCLIY